MGKIGTQAVVAGVRGRIADSTVAVGVIAFRHGGAAAVGLVGVARMIPAALVAPLAAMVADQARREWVLAWVGVVRVESRCGGGD